jgi:hypothetical protein
VKLLYAIAFTFFPLAAPIAAPAQSPDTMLLTALCQDDYYEDTARRCSGISAGEFRTAEAVIERYEIIVTDDALVVLNQGDPEDIAVGSIQPRSEGPTGEHLVVTDDESKAQPATEQDTVAAKVVPAEPQTADECADDITVTGPTAQPSAPLAAAPVEGEPMTE